MMPKKVLFVDDSPEYLEMLGRVLGIWSAGEWQILLAHSGSEAFSLLQEQTVDLAVIDLMMPVVDGVQFLRMLHRSHPSMRKVVLTGVAEPASRRECLHQGADLFLEKPRAAAGLEAVYQALKQVLAQEEESGFRGVLRRVGLTDVIQIECLNRSSSVLEVAGTQVKGEVFIERGQVVHAQTAELKGVDAFCQIVNLTSGDFNLKHFSEPAERTILASCEHLLLMAAHGRDEALASEPCTARPTEPIQPKVRSSNTTWFRRNCENDTIGTGPGEADGSASPIGGLPGTGALADTATPPRHHAPASGGRATPQAVPRRPSTVDEMLVVSAQGEVLFEWQCADRATRLELVQSFGREARQAGVDLGLGDLDRVELQGGDWRAVASFEGERRVFAKTRREIGLTTTKPAYDQTNDSCR